MTRNRRKSRQGFVIRANQDKTVIVAVERWFRQPLYGKVLRRSKKYYVHDATQRCKVGDVVRIEETRPISRLKRWRVVEVLAHQDVPEVKPLELDQQAQEEEAAATSQPASQEQAPPEVAVGEEAEGLAGAVEDSAAASQEESSEPESQGEGER